jgi:geranylgeranyl reductase
MTLSSLAEVHQGATAAHEIALAGHRVLLLERAFRIKPCGGAIPPCMLEEFDIPRSLLKAEIQSARMISPTVQKVDMPIEGTFVGMVDRDEFDPWLRSRAQQAGAELELAAFKKLEYLDDTTIQVTYVSKDHGHRSTPSNRTLRIGC